MLVILKIAFRNLREHKIKTLIIGTIVAIGIMILVVGNSLIDTATSGIRKMFIDNYTGHIIVTGTKKPKGAMGMAQMPSGSGLFQPAIPEYEKIRQFLMSIPQVSVFTPQATVIALLNVGESTGDDTLTPGLVYGIDPDQYQKVFPGNIELLQGEFLNNSEEGILLSKATVRRLLKTTGKTVKPGDKILLSGMLSEAGIKIREIPVKGIFKFKNADLSLAMVSLADIQTVRILNGMTIAATETGSSQQEKTAPAESVNEESLFGGDDDMISSVATVKSGERDLDSILGDTSERSRVSQIDSGAWQSIRIKVRHESQMRPVIKKLNNFFKEQGIAAKATEWLDGAGGTARIAYIVKSLFNFLALIIAVVAVIIIMNTLVISITERIPEIGTIRAIGATKGFVRQMVISETVLIAGIFGLVGIMAAMIILGILNLTGITASNFFFQIIFGGKVLKPVLSIGAMLRSLFVVIIVGIGAALYPVSIALKIQPVQAIQKE